MPQTRDIALEQLTASGNALPISGTRIDAAHSLGDALAAERPLAEMPVAEAIAELVRVEGAVQLQSQADQLAAHLRQRQQEIDRREAQLNARLADFEKEVRDARLWLAERNDALNEREARMESSEVSVQGSGVRSQESGARRAPRFRVQQTGAADTESVPEYATVGQRSRPSFPADGPEGRPMDSLRQKAEWDAQEVALARKSEELDRRQAELEKFQEKVSQMHREALQLRLAAEEAQAELRASLGDERADDAVALSRRRLARYFNDEVAELARLRNELEWLKSEQMAGPTT